MDAKSRRVAVVRHTGAPNGLRSVLIVAARRRGGEQCSGGSWCFGGVWLWLWIVDGLWWWWTVGGKAEVKVSRLRGMAACLRLN